MEVKSIESGTFPTPGSNESRSWVFLYIGLTFFVIGLQNYVFSNYNDGNVQCKPQMYIVVGYTLAAIFFVLCPIMYFILIFDWNRIFANTFGLMLVNKIEMGSGNPEYFYRDPNILLQEMDAKVLFDKKELNTKLTELFKAEGPVVSDEVHQTIKTQYVAKQNVGYFTWLTLTGIIASLISTNSILLQDCFTE